MSTFAKISVVARSGTASLMLANLAAAFMGIATGVIAARALGAQGRGDLAVVILWPALLTTLVDFGIADAVTLRCARDPEARSRHYRNAVGLAAGAGVLGMLAGTAVLPVVLRADQSALMALCRAALLSIPASLLAAVPVGVLMGMQRFRAVAAIRFSVALAYTCAMVAAVVAGHGTVEVLMWLYVAARAAPLLVGAPLLMGTSRGSARTSVGRGRIDEQVGEGMKLHGARLAYVVGGAEDRAIASWTLTQRGIGIWQVPHALSTVMQFVAQAVSQQLFSRAAGGGSEKRDLVYRAYQRATVLTAAVAVGGSVSLPWVVPLLYGEEFRAAVPIGIVIMFGAIPAASVMTLQAGAKAMLNTKICVISESFGIAVMAAVAWPAVAAWNEMGLAAAYVLGRVAALLVMAASSRRLFGFSPTTLLPWSRPFVAQLAEEARRLHRSPTTPKASAGAEV